MITMLDYFCEQVSCPEIPTICAKLGNLKRRITLGDYTTPKKEFDECQCLFDAIKQRAITSKNEPLANAQFVYKSYFQVFCTLSTYWDCLKHENIDHLGQYFRIVSMALNSQENS